MNFKQLRLSRNMTQEDVATQLGVQRSTVAMWETTNARPRASMLVKLAALYGCTVDDLLRDTAPTDKQKPAEAFGFDWNLAERERKE